MKTTLTILLLTLSLLTFGQEIPESTEDNNIYTLVDVPAEYPGGVNKMYDYINKEIVYPDEAVENNISRRVFVEYTVEKDGSLTDIKVAKKVGFGYDEEAIRLFSSMPKWIPGKIDGKPVRHKMIYHFHIQIKD